MNTKNAQEETFGKHINYKNLEVAGIGILPKKTSAQIVSEAKAMLIGPGAKLVSTRRPVTPRDCGRQLYGAKLALPGRPPSSFSLKYLQLENVRALPPLEPMCQQKTEIEEILKENFGVCLKKSGSMETLLDQKLFLKLNENILEDEKQRNIFIVSSQVASDTQSDQSTTRCLHHILQRQAKSFDIPLKSHNQLEDEFYKGHNDNSKKMEKTFIKKNEEQYQIDQNKMTSNECYDNLEDAYVSAIGSEIVKPGVLVKTTLLSKSSFDMIIDLLKAHNGIKDCNDETVQHINAILLELHKRIKGTINPEWRSITLVALYGLVECVSAKILLGVARVVLALSVTGSNLAGACKLVFKVARNESNDFLFFESDVPELLIDGLGRASPLEDPEACIYGYGAVRFLFNASLSTILESSPVRTLNKDGMINKKQKNLALRLTRAGAVQLMVLHLQILNEAGAEKLLVGHSLHALYQLSAALRALAGVSNFLLEKTLQTHHKLSSTNAKNYEDYLKNSTSTQEETCKDVCAAINSFTTGEQTLTRYINLEFALPHLVKAAEIFAEESEIQRNIVRTLSVLSDHEVYCCILANHVDRIGMLLDPSKMEVISDDLEAQRPLGILSRLGYILGNIMAKFDYARIQFYYNEKAMEYLLEIINAYSEQRLPPRNQSEDSAVEILIKLIRVIANMSVNEEVGSKIGSKSFLGKIILRLILKINKIKSEEMTDDIEELLKAILGAMHNLCFYQDQNLIEESYINKPDSESKNIDLTCINELIPEYSIALRNTLSFNSKQIKADVSRVLGNLTRNAAARNSFCAVGGFKVIIECLQIDDYDIVSACSGVLVNLLGDSERRVLFHDMGGPLVLQDVLEKSVKQLDWFLARITCQAFWNYLIDSPNIVSALGENETNIILAQLLEYLDDENIFQGCRPDTLWEQFACVATDLLERIQANLEQ